MENVLCSCLQRADQICITHKTYFCAQHAKNHKCKTTSLFSFIKQTRNKKKELLYHLRSLSAEMGSSTHDLLLTNKDIVDSIKKLKESANANLDSIISHYSTKVDNLINLEVHNREKEIKEKLHHFDRDLKFIELDDYLSSVKYGKIRKQQRFKVEKLKELLSIDSIYSNLFHYINIIERQSAGILRGMSQVRFNSLLTLENDQTQDFNNFSKTIGRHTKFFQTTESPKEESLVEIQTINPVKEFTGKLDSSVIEKELKKLGTINFDRSHLKNSSVILDKEVAFRFHLSRLSPSSKHTLPRLVTSILKDNNIFKKSLLQLEEIEIEESIVENGVSLKKEEIEVMLKEAVDNFRELLLQTARHIEKAEFFNTNSKPTVNDYFIDYQQNQSELVKDILVNFNKL